MKRILSAAILLAIFQFPGTSLCRAAAPYMNFTIEELAGFGNGGNSLYRVSGSDVNLDVQNNSFQNDPFAKYEFRGSMFGRQPDFSDSIQNDEFGGTSGVIVNTQDIYAKFSRQTSFQELRVESRLVPGADPRVVILLSVLANYLPRIPGASSSGGGFPDQNFTLRQFGDSVLADGAGLADVRIERDGSSQNYRYTVRGSAFGKNFDGPDSLYLEMDGAFLGAGGVRVRGAGMDLEIKKDDFGGPRLTVRGAAGDSAQLALFTMAVARYLNTNY